MTAVIGTAAGSSRRAPSFDARPVDDVTVVVPQGTLDGDALRQVLDAVELSEIGGLLIDLSECVIIDLGVRESLVPEFWGLDSDRFCLVCGRLSGRRLLARAGLHERVAVFASTGDAHQARRMHRCGYGPGWEPSR